MPLCGSSAAVQQSIGGFHYERSSRVRNLILREHSARFAGANSTAGVREREDASRTREAGDSVLVKTEG